MKAILAILVIAAVASATELQAFRGWMQTQNKRYTAKEEARRFAIFKENAAIAERLNLEHPRAHFGANNKFADLTNAEFASIYATGLKSGRQFMQMPVEAAPRAGELDLRDTLPAVKDQAQCGSCWAFSAVANMEGATYKVNGGEVVSLSEQQLVSCDTANSACNGGSMVLAFQYAVKKGMTSEKNYPYTSGKGKVAKCNTTAIKDVVAQFEESIDLGYVSADSKVMTNMKKYGPISIGIAASTSYFQLYNSGILDDADQCGSALDHGVALVGYGTDADGVDYWLVRNSWGDSWGEEGYVRFARGIDMCGMNEMQATSTPVAAH